MTAAQGDLLGPHLQARSLPVGRLALIIVVLLVMLSSGRLWWLPARAPLDVNEGWNAMQAMRAFNGSALYPAPDALTANNYPPLSFYIVGSLGRLLGDNIIAGRMIALAAQIAVGGSIFACLRRVTGSKQPAFLGAALFGLLSTTLLREYLAMNDPQWLSSACMGWSLAIAIPPRGRRAASHGAIALAASLIVVGVFIKHNELAIPIAVTFWLLSFRRTSLLVWILSGAALATAACVIMLHVWGTTPFVDILASDRSFSGSRMVVKSAPVLLPMLPASVVAFRSRYGDAPTRSLIKVLLVAAISLGVVQCAGDGVSVNAFFDLAIVLATGVPLAYQGAPPMAGRLLLAAVVPLLLALPIVIRANLQEFLTRDREISSYRHLSERLAAADGAVACDDQAACYWAGRDAGMDLFITKQRLLKGRASAFRNAISEKRFAMIEMRAANTSWHGNLAEPMILANYRKSFEETGIELLTPIR